MKCIWIAALLLAASLPAQAQLLDLQPGRNYPTAVNAFGGSSSEDLELGDVDNDGDPAGTSAWWQLLVDAPGTLHGITLSNAVQSISP